MLKILFSGLICLTLAAPCLAQQLPSASEEHKVLKMDEGKWDAKVSVWMEGPDKKPDISSATETNTMMGDMWSVSEFKATFGGQPFSGHGVFGYDPEKKKYTGMWVDSMMPTMGLMEGKYDKEKKTMTFMMNGKGMDGKPQKSKLVTVYKTKDSRVMTMYVEMDGKFVKNMEIAYTRKK